MFPETPYRPKLLKKAPSMRAINNYNNIRTTLDKDDGTEEEHTYDNYMFFGDDTSYSSKVAPSEISYHNYTNTAGTLRLSDLESNKLYMNTNMYGSPNDIIPMSTIGRDTDITTYDYPTWKSSSGTAKSSDQDNASRKEDLGSTSKLVSAKVKSNCSTCYVNTEIVLCTAAIALNLGNLYRLPAQLVWGGNFIPFLITYVLLSLVLGLPLLVLEIGIGQIIQEGLLKTWRAVPFFRGVGYIKLFAGILLTMYYPVYIGMALYYFGYLLKGQLPFSECATVKLTEKGYSADGITGLQCLKKTFLESPFEDPTWFGIYAGLILLIWIITMILLLRGTKSYTGSLMFLLLLVISTFVYMIIVAVNEGSFENINKNIRWELLYNPGTWYLAAIQVFYSTNIGFGVFVTNGRHLYKKAHPLLTALGYTILNVIFGVAVMLLFYSLGEPVRKYKFEIINQVGLLANIYDVGLHLGGNQGRTWAIVAYVFVVSSGIISMVTLVYTILKSISIDTRRRYKWWQMLSVYCFIGFVVGAAILLCERLQIVNLLDFYVVGNLMLISIFIDVIGFVLYYGSKRVLSDFEFITGNKVSKVWVVLWWLAPFITIAIFIWYLATRDWFDGFADPVWVYGTGMAIVLTAIVFILAMGCYNVSKQDEYYTFSDKLKASFKCSRKWGPIDPIIRYNWVQWHSKAKDGQRDFTLKRRGTRDYAHSVKKRSKTAKTYTPAMSDVSTVTPSGTYNKNDQNQNNIRVSNGSNTSYVEPFYISSTNTVAQENPLRVTSLVDAMDPPGATYLNSRNSGGVLYKTNLNPLAQPHVYEPQQNDGSNSEGYGTFRKGPYIIGDANMEHVCHRRNSEEATEL